MARQLNKCQFEFKYVKTSKMLALISRNLLVPDLMTDILDWAAMILAVQFADVAGLSHERRPPAHCTRAVTVLPPSESSLLTFSSHGARNVTRSGARKTQKRRGWGELVGGGVASHSDSSGLSVWRLVQGGASVMRVLLLALNEKEESRFWGLQLFFFYRLFLVSVYLQLCSVDINSLEQMDMKQIRHAHSLLGK